ncbi:MAG: hypothetical protein ACTHMC_15600 [Pseudobacter sp.]|uniref:hypothetical protein n=1 Tax=Pseudobacter sp. TaxID=2045420 RepID=UPI003F7E358E
MICNKDNSCTVDFGNRYKPPSEILPIFAAMHVQDDLMTRWWTLEAKLVERFGKKPDMETILFLIGIQELGVKPKFTKEQKQDLMHIAVCALMSQSGYYELEGIDRDGWPHYKQLKSLPVMNMIEQENFMKDHILLYFDRVGL